MSGFDRPGRISRVYHRLSPAERADIAREVDRLFAQKTGVTRKLHRSSRGDRELRATWLRIRDEVLGQREIDQDMQFRRELFESEVVDVVLGDMEFEGWTEAVRLLQIWAERSPAVKPVYSSPPVTDISLDWVLRFSRARSVFDAILRERIWTNEASQEQIAKYLKATPRRTGERFGNLSMPVVRINEEWINSRPVERGWAYDELAGALGSFHLQVAVEGKLLVDSGAFQLSVDEIGIYVKDDFHFNDDGIEGFLGIWGHRDEPVSDADFRKWRKEHGKGGDFLVFSDVKRIPRTPPDVISGKL